MIDNTMKKQAVVKMPVDQFNEVIPVFGSFVGKPENN
jgi:hypothetical protein